MIENFTTSDNFPKQVFPLQMPLRLRDEHLPPFRPYPDRQPYGPDVLQRGRDVVL
jgi:hypothetical protein